MIDPRELRIGNLIEHEDGGGIVEGIHYFDEGNYKILIGNHLIGNHLRPVSEIKPVEITDEWLLKFGFEKQISPETENYNEDTWQWEKHEACAYWIKKGNDPDPELSIFPRDGIYKFGKTELKYIHQLQNLYYCLTNGQEFRLVRF